jgi:cyclopropane-fatty-acyl-phospholipid synthase
VFEREDMTLEEASVAKLDELCRQLELQPEDHLLEIGTGWGGMAIHAARHYGCRVTTTTISREQFEYACRRVEEEGLADRVTVLCEDYRNLQGSYDKLVSIEMIEAVGHQYYGDYFRTCSGLLRDNGKMVIQAITVPDQRYREARDAVDFIKHYIFPGGCLPSNAVIADHVARDTDMQVVHLRDITLDYAETLAHWRERFLGALDSIREQGFSDDFIRMWEYYLCYCEGGFRERIIGTVQMAFAKPGYRP